MEKFKGTTKPWRIDDDDPTFSAVASDTYHHISAGGGYHNEEKNKGFGISGFMSIHDANLIAASPELLEALQKMVSKACKQNWNDAYPEEIKSAQAAINKALGE